MCVGRAGAKAQRDADGRAEPPRNRGARLRAALMAHSAWLDQHVATVDDDLATTPRTSPVWREGETW
jgi:hypothetical protein